MRGFETARERWDSVTADLKDHHSLKSWRLELLRKSSGRHSQILKYRSQERSCQVIVKRINDSIKAENAIAAILHEFESLVTVRDRLPAHFLDTVPKPLMVLPDSRALVLNALSGTPLSVILKREANRFVGPFRRMRMQALGRLIGEWLRQFHESTRTDPIPHDSRVFLDALEERFVQCRTVGLAQDSIDTVRRLISSASDRWEGHPVPAAATQGDFIPQNLLVDGGRLAVVDFEAFCQRQATYEDVAIFLAYIQAMSTFPYYSQAALQRLTDSFLHAYGLTVDGPLLKLYLAASLVVLVSELNVSRSAPYGPRRLSLMLSHLHRVCEELPYASAA